MLSSEDGMSASSLLQSLAAVHSSSHCLQKWAVMESLLCRVARQDPEIPLEFLFPAVKTEVSKLLCGARRNTHDHIQQARLLFCVIVFFTSTHLDMNKTSWGAASAVEYEH